jgi:HTH-type transcriptional regulator, transcriptional repressor of NAD biosynthesis genes
MVVERFRTPAATTVASSGGGGFRRLGSRLVDAVKRVCLLGAESTGKSTLAAALAERFDTLWNPEYGRPYTQIGRPAGESWTSREFVHIARIHCWYEDFLAELARDVLFSDTDAFTTGVFHEVYLGTPATGFEDLVDRHYDLFVVCGLDAPWRHDGIREFEEQRRTMHDRYVERARTSGSPWVLVEGPPDVRLEVAAAEVERLLGKR